MNLNIQLISNGFVVALQTPQQGQQIVFVPNKEATLAMVQEIFKGIQQAPPETGEASNVTPLPRN